MAQTPGKPSKLAAKVLAKKIKRQVIAKQRGWYGRRGTAMNGKLARRQADHSALSTLSLTPSENALASAIAAKAL
jgi:hypothetical protein